MGTIPELISPSVLWRPPCHPSVRPFRIRFWSRGAKTACPSESPSSKAGSRTGLRVELAGAGSWPFLREASVGVPRSGLTKQGTGQNTIDGEALHKSQWQWKLSAYSGIKWKRKWIQEERRGSEQKENRLLVIHTQEGEYHLHLLLLPPWHLDKVNRLSKFTYRASC